MTRALVLGLLAGYAAGCSGSQPADTAQQTPDTGPIPRPRSRKARQLSGPPPSPGPSPSLRTSGSQAARHDGGEKHAGKPAPNEALVGPGIRMGNAGGYDVTAWPDRLGTHTASVTVAANSTETQDFTSTVAR